MSELRLPPGGQLVMKQASSELMNVTMSKRVRDTCGTLVDIILRFFLCFILLKLVVAVYKINFVEILARKTSNSNARWNAKLFRLYIGLL